MDFKREFFLGDFGDELPTEVNSLRLSLSVEGGDG